MQEEIRINGIDIITEIIARSQLQITIKITLKTTRSPP